MVDAVEVYDTLYSAKARKSDTPLMGSHTGSPAARVPDTAMSDSAISVAELLEAVKDEYPEFLSDDVREHFNITAPPKDPYARFSIDGLHSDTQSGMMDAPKEVSDNDREGAVYSGLVVNHQGDQNRPYTYGAVRAPKGDNRGQVRYRELTEPERNRAQRILMPAAEESREWRKIIRQFPMDEATEMIYNWAVDNDPRIEAMKRQIPGFAEAVERRLEKLADLYDTKHSAPRSKTELTT